MHRAMMAQTLMMRMMLLMTARVMAGPVLLLSDEIAKVMKPPPILLGLVAGL